MDEVINILNPMTSTIFWSAVVFVIMAVVLWRFVFKPVNNMISKRQHEIRENIDNADRRNTEAQKYLDDQKVELEVARKEAKNIIDQGREVARKIREEMEDKAGEKARIMLEEALAEIEREKERSINEVKNDMVDIALSASAKIVSKTLSREEHRKLIEENLKELRKV